MTFIDKIKKWLTTEVDEKPFKKLEVTKHEYKVELFEYVIKIKCDHGEYIVKYEDKVKFNTRFICLDSRYSAYKDYDPSRKEYYYLAEEFSPSYANNYVEKLQNFGQGSYFISTYGGATHVPGPTIFSYDYGDSQISFRFSDIKMVEVEKKFIGKGECIHYTRKEDDSKL